MERDTLWGPRRVGRFCHVHPCTVIQWTRSGLLNVELTRGGHHRYRESVIRTFLGLPAGPLEQDPLMTPRVVAKLLRVSPQTLHRWAVLGRIESVSLPAGRYRYRESVIRQLIQVPKGPIDADPLMTAGEVARRLGKPVKAIEYLSRTGMLPRIEIATQTYRYRQSDIDRWARAEARIRVSAYAQT